MAKNYLLAKTCLITCLLIGAISVNSQISYALQEGFESGIPQTWSQVNVSGSTKWIVETGGQKPSGTAEGNVRAVLRNNTQQTQGYVTKLVTPVLNLKDVYQPVLIFSHAQEHNLGDVDELRIYYRTSSSEPWILLEEYKDRIRQWTSDTVSLVSPTGTYQVAFEGTDKFGSGIVLDNIRIRPKPICTQPTVSFISEASANSFVLNYTGSFDADSFAIKVSSTLLTDIETATNFVLDTIVTSFSCPVKNLTAGGYYYSYIKSYCSGEESPWSEVYSYRTKATVNLPYSQNFNFAYNAGVINRLTDWTWGNSWPDAQYSYCPHINTNIAESTRANYSRTATSCVVFTGSNNSTTAISAGEWAYLTSPEVVVDDIKKVQVSFWGTAYTYVGGDYASSLIVGVMTDPEDISTFVPVDTATITASKTFNEFIITLDKYEGNGKYIAFVSNFNKENIFYLDDVVIELIPECRKVTKVTATNIQPTSVSLKWNDAKSSGYTVVVSSEAITSIESVNPTKIVYQTTTTTNTCVVPENTLNPWTTYFVYVQASCSSSSGSWSNEYSFQTPCAGSLPMYFTFEESEGLYQNGSSASYSISNCLIAKSQHSVLPYSYSSYALEGTRSLWLIGNPYSNAYVTFPALDSLSNVRMTLFAKASSASYVGTQSIIEIGVMTNIDDFSTFTPIDTIVAQADYEHYLISFAKYAGKGNIAIAVSSLNTGFCYVNIDNLKIEAVPDCSYPMELSVEAEETTALIKWNPAGTSATQYRLKLADVSIKDSVETAICLLDTIVTTNSCLVPNLLPNKKKYYYYIQTICGETESSEWTYEKSFITLCTTQTPLPFTEDFEAYAGGSATEEIPVCWDTEFAYYSYSGYGSYYPYISGSTSYAYSGSKSLYLSSGTSSPNHADYVVLPKMNANVKNLQVSFMLYHSAANYALEVGVISDPTDTTTFIPVETITATSETKGVYQEVTVALDSYSGSGEYIMLRSKGGYSNYNYVDDIKVDYISDCQKPKNLKVKDIETHKATLFWDKGGDETAWDLIILNKSDVLPSEAPDSVIVFRDTISTTTYVLPDTLTENTLYYYYLRSICGTSSTAWTLNSVAFRTSCVPKTTEGWGTETFELNETNFDCWEVGVQIGTSSAPYISTSNNSRRLYIFNTTSSDGAYAIMPPIDFDSIQNMRVSFTGFTTSTTTGNQKSIIVGVITNTSDFASFVPIDTIQVELNNIMDYTVNFDSYVGDYQGDYGKRIIFYSSFGVEGTTNYIYLDNIRVDTIPSCPNVTKVWADSIGTYGAHLTWDGESASTYRVIVSAHEIATLSLDTATIASGIVVDSIVSGVGLEVSELEMLKQYYVYVKTICSPTESSTWSNQRSFTTICPIAYSLPYKESFDAYGTETTTATSAKLPCWTRYYGTASSQSTSLYPYLNSSYNNTFNGVAGLYFYATTANYYTMAVSPTLDVDDVSKAQLSFFARNYSSVSTSYLGSKLIVGLTTSTDNLTLDSFTPIDTICIGTDQANPVSTEWYKYSYNLSSLKDDSLATKYKHLVFVMDRSINVSSSGTVGATGYMAIDDIEFELIPTCQKPEYLGVKKITSSSAVAYWTDAVASTWNVQYGATGFNIGEGTTLSSDTTELFIPNLTPGTAYDIYVQANCGEADGLSAWTGPITVSTKCLVNVTDAHWGFEDEDGFYYGALSTSNKLPACWTPGHSNPVATSVPYNQANTYNSSTGAGTYQYSKTGESALRMFVSSSYKPYAYASTPELNANLDTLQVRFSARALYTFAADYVTEANRNKVSSNYADTENPHIIIGSIEDPDDFSSFDEIVKIDLSRWETSDVASEANNYLWDDLVVPLYGAKGKFITFAVSYEASGNNTYYTYLDDVSVEKESVCANPGKLRFENIDTYVTKADLAWRPIGSLATSWFVKVSEGANTIYEGEVTSSIIPNLTVSPETTYKVEIRSSCVSDTLIVELTTPCVPLTAGQVYGFEEEGGYSTTGVSSGTGASYLAPDCWVVGNKNSISYTYIPYRIKNGGTTSTGGTSTTTYNYSYSGSNALKIYSSSSYNGAYAIMPAFVGNADTLQLHFHARAGFAHPTYTPEKGYKITTTYTGSTYARSLVVGTVTDPSDISTFVPMDTIVMRELTTSDYGNEDNNYLFDEYVIPLAGAKGKNVAFLSEFGLTNYAFLDNIAVETLGGCFAPKNLSFSSISSTSAQVQWTLNGTEGKAWVIAVATNEAMSSNLRLDTVYTHEPYTIIGLNKATDYYVSIQQLCDDDASSNWTEVSNFRTATTVVFNHNFDEFRHNPSYWSRYNGKFTENVVYTVNLSNTLESVTGSTAGWVRHGGGAGLPTAHQYVTVYYTSSDEWLVTPLVEIPSEPTWLLFDLALTGYGVSTPVMKTTDGDDDRFVVAISDDGGYSWKKSNITEWNNAGTGHYVFDSIANMGEQIEIDLSAYAGKAVKVAFYAESTKGSSAIADRRADIHIDNVRINRFAKNMIQANTCSGYDYEDRLFSIEYDQVVEGANTFKHMNLSSNNSVADTLTTLELTVNPWIKREISDTMCEGYAYNSFNFFTEKAGSYKQKLSSVTGCDSLVVLNLTSIPSARVNVFDTICQGVPYIFNDKEYTRSGQYIDTLTSVATGCDSIVTLYLRVKDVLSSERYVTICHSETYSFGGKTLSKSNTYRDTLQTTSGCDSIAVLHLTVRPILRTVITDVVCPGTPYTGHGFVGVPAATAEFERVEKTKEGCDSTIVLSLTLLDTDTTKVNKSIPLSELPYTYYGKTYPVGTPVGVYTDTTYVNNGGDCNTVVIATLTIEEGTGLFYPNVYDLSIIPTIIEVGGEIKVASSENSNEKLSIEVYDMLGRAIYIQQSAYQPITLNVFSREGVYLIRAISESNKVISGRVIVK